MYYQEEQIEEFFIEPPVIFRDWISNIRTVKSKPFDIITLPFYPPPLLHFKFAKRKQNDFLRWRTNRINPIFQFPGNKIHPDRFLLFPEEDDYSYSDYLSIMSKFHYISLIYPYARDYKSFLMFF